MFPDKSLILVAVSVFTAPLGTGLLKNKCTNAGFNPSLCAEFGLPTPLLTE